MIIKGKFVAMLIGENSEVRNRKTDGQLYTYRTVAIMQDGLVDNVRIDEPIFNDLKNMEHFKQYEMFFTFNTDYSNFLITDMRLFGGAK